MSFQAKELREKRAPIKKRIDELAGKIHTENRAFTPEERVEFDKLAEDFKGLTRSIADVEKAKQLAAENDSEADPIVGRHDSDPTSRKGKLAREAEMPTEEHRALAFQAWIRSANGKSLKKTHVDACKRLNFNPNRKSLTIRRGRVDNRTLRREGTGWQSRAMDVVPADNVGGQTVPTGFVKALEVALLSYDGAYQVADVFSTDTGMSMPWPTLNDTGNTGELMTENTAGSAADPATSSVTFSAYKFGSKLVAVSNELMSDSAFNMSEVVGELCGIRLGRVRNTYHTTGTGTSQPQGIITGASAGVTAAGATAIAVNDLVGLIGSVDPAYRRDPSTAFMFHDGILTSLLKLQDTLGRPLYQASVRDGAPDKINGYPFAINQAMQATIVTATKTVLFGAMKKFKVRDVGVVRLRRLDERYAEKDQTGFLAFIRSDSHVLNAGVPPLKFLTQA